MSDIHTNFYAEIIADSLNEQGNRLTTFVITFPRMVLAEVNTHKLLGKNSASSRAIPFKTMVRRVKDSPFIPIMFQKKHSGMQGYEYWEEGPEHDQRVEWWLRSRDAAVVQATEGDEALGVTKQICNRLLEPFLWHTAIITGSDAGWQNFFALRAHEAAEIHFAKIAHMMLKAYSENEPKMLKPGQWHVPFGDKIYSAKITEDLELDSQPGSAFLAEVALKIATARIARVSYLNFEGKDNYAKDIERHDSLVDMGHWSPFEHCAKCMKPGDPHPPSNLGVGWLQYRKQFDGECRKDPRVPSWGVAFGVE